MTAPLTPTTGAAVPLDQPYYGASLGVAFSRFWKKYATFSGRASRSEYWWWALVYGVVVTVLYVVAAIAGAAGATVDAAGRTQPGPGIILPAILLVVWSLATIVPTLALTWRRLHDANFSGAFWFLSLIPIGGIVVFVFTLLPSNPVGARFDRR